MMSFLPIVLFTVIIIIGLLAIKGVNLSKRQKGRSKKYFTVYSIFVVASVVVYFFLAQGIDTKEEAGIEYGFGEVEEIYEDPPIPYPEIDDLKVVNRWRFDVQEPRVYIQSYMQLNHIQVKRRDDNDPFIEVNYLRPHNIYINGITVPDEEIQNPSVQFHSDQLSIDFPEVQYHINQRVVTKEVIVSNFITMEDDHYPLSGRNNIYDQVFYITVPNDLEIEHAFDDYMIHIFE